MTILIAYATSRGSTQGIAERLVVRLRERGHSAEARRVTAPIRVSDYEAVVLGSAVHGGKWLPEATAFANENAGMLKGVPLWLFSVSTLGDNGSMFPPRVARRLRAVRKETEEITALCAAVAPLAHVNFAGAVSRNDWPPAGRAFFRAMGGRYGDHRNWAAVDAWAAEIAEYLASDAPALADPAAGASPSRLHRTKS